MKKFYFFLVAMLLGVITSSATDYAIGGMATGGWPSGDWKDSNVHIMTQTSNGVYTYDATGECSGAFLIVEYNVSTKTPNWNNKIGSNGAKITEGAAYKYSVGGSDLSWNGNIMNAHFVLDTNAKTLTVTGQVSENHFDVVYMVGDFGNNWDTNTTEYPLAAVAGKADTYEGTYTINTTAAGAQYFYTVPKCGGQVLQLTSGTDVTIDATTSGKSYTLGTGSGSFACAPGTYKFTVVADQAANTGTITITMTDAPAPEENTIYWDNSTAAWETVYAYAVNDSNVAFEEKPGTELSDLGNGIWSATIPANYTKVTFSNGEGAEYGAYTIQNEYIYGPDQSGKPYEEPVDYSSWWVNICGDFNGWADNGLQPVNGLTEHKNLNIGTKGFKVKIWNGTEDVWFSTGGTIATDQWVKISGNAEAGMTIAGATADEAFNVEFNCATDEIRVTKAGAIDYSEWWFNIVGDFNEWSTLSGAQFNADGTAVNTYTNVNTSFKVSIWNGDADVYYAKDGILVANQWNDVNANQDNMTLPASLQNGKVTFTFNNNTKELKVEADTSAVEAIEMEENVAPVYYNLQGVRVDAPANGLYIVVRGDKVAKEYVK